MDRLTALFGSPDAAVDTFGTMSCLDEGFTDCIECAFYVLSGWDNAGPCPSYPEGFRHVGTGEELGEWLAGEVDERLLAQVHQRRDADAHA